MKKHLLLAAALATLGNTAVAAPSEGDWEIVFSTAGGELKFVDGETNLNVGAHAGYFLDMNHEIGGFVGLGFDTAADQSESLDLGAFYRYNWVKSSTDEQWWYAGAELNLQNVTDEFAEPMLVRLHGGQKYMLSDDVAFDWNAGYQFDLSDLEQEDEIGVRFGLSIFF